MIKITATLSKDHRSLPLGSNKKIMEAIQKITYVRGITHGIEEKRGRFVHFELIITIALENRLPDVVKRLKEVLSKTQYSFFGYRKE